jgi:signal transduction histidine kinase
VAIAGDVDELARTEAVLANAALQREMLLQLGRPALEATDTRLLMQEAVEGVARNLGADLVYILEVGPGGDELRQCAGFGWNDAAPPTVSAGPSSHAGYTIRLGTDHPVFVSDLRTETRFTTTALLHEHGVVSGMMVAIGGVGGAFGVLGVYTRRPRTFTDDEALFVRAVANLLGATATRSHVDDQRERARRRAEDANQAKDRFLATLSHELRNPLSAMFTWVSVLKGGRTDAVTTRQIYDGLERVATTQARLIDDLLDVSRIISGKLSIARDRVALDEPVRAALELNRREATAKGLTLDAEIAADVGTVLGDATRLQQVASNVLTNAIKFTPAGGTVTLRLRRIDATAEMVVEDTGTGIAPENLPHVFERFHQAEEGHRGGLGLGLSIVRYLVEAQGGRVSVASPGPSGRGTAVTVRVPLLRVGDVAPSVRTAIAVTDRA